MLVTAQYNGYRVSSSGGKLAEALTTHPHLALRLKKEVELSSIFNNSLLAPAKLLMHLQITGNIKTNSSNVFNVGWMN
jgi:hypothetical protein